MPGDPRGGGAASGARTGARIRLSAAFEELCLAADDSVGDVDELFCLLGADVVEAVGVELPQVQPMPGPR